MSEETTAVTIEEARDSWRSCGGESWEKAAIDALIAKRLEVEKARHEAELAELTADGEAREEEIRKLCGQIERLQAELKEAVDKEKTRRVYYQDIVYKVCNWIDQVLGTPGISAGTSDSPSNGVANALTNIAKRMKDREDEHAKELLAERTETEKYLIAYNDTLADMQASQQRHSAELKALSDANEANRQHWQTNKEQAVSLERSNWEAYRSGEAERMAQIKTESQTWEIAAKGWEKYSAGEADRIARAVQKEIVACVAVLVKASNDRKQRACYVAPENELKACYEHEAAVLESAADMLRLRYESSQASSPRPATENQRCPGCDRIMGGVSSILCRPGRCYVHPVVDKQDSCAQVGGNHYTKYSIEPWDALLAWLGREQFIGYCRGQAFEYQVRYRDKGGIQDLQKARHNLEKLIEVEGATA